MALRRLFLMGIFVILPVVLEAQYNRSLYPSGWLNHFSVNSKHPKDSEVIVSESYHDYDNVENGKFMSNRAADESDKRKELYSNIIFPDESILLARNEDANVEDKVNLVPTCKEKNFCLNDPNYPTNLVNQMLNRDPSLKHYATMDVVETITHRIDLGDDQLCESKIHLIVPRSAKNIENDWLFIVQSAESNFTQAIRIESCMMEDTACQKIEGFALGYKTICKQKFIYRQLVAISHQGKLVQELFSIPASCCCHLIMNEVF